MMIKSIANMELQLNSGLEWTAHYNKINKSQNRVDAWLDPIAANISQLKTFTVLFDWQR